jgi:succinoglycan biosynthesis protein ExoA
MTRPSIQVTVVIPARREAADIGRCLEALADQDLPLDGVQVVVVDGSSDDGTADLARAAVAGTAFGRVDVVDNPVATTPSNLNVGLALAEGRYLCRVDARSLVPPDYLRRCTATLEARTDVAVVGGGQRAVARGRSAREIGIARALNNRLTMGLARYRRGGPDGPADTVYLGAFRTDELRAAGGWDERLGTNQDFDLNRRMGASGTVWFLGDVSVGYIPRADHATLFRQYVRFGAAKARYWRDTRDRPRPRQVVLLAAAPVAGLTAAGWLSLSGRRRSTATGLAVGVALAVEGLGTTGPSGGARARASAVLAVACVAGGWSYGAWRGLLRGGGR